MHTRFIKAAVSAFVLSSLNQGRGPHAQETMACPPQTTVSSGPSPPTSRLTREGSLRPPGTARAVERHCCHLEVDTATRGRGPPPSSGYPARLCSLGTTHERTPQECYSCLTGKGVVTDVSTATRLKKADRVLSTKPHVFPGWSLLACHRITTPLLCPIASDTRPHRALTTLHDGTCLHYNKCPRRLNRRSEAVLSNTWLRAIGSCLNMSKNYIKSKMQFLCCTSHIPGAQQPHRAGGHRSTQHGGGAPPPSRQVPPPTPPQTMSQPVWGNAAAS